jgi:succinoglycan biosynthesis protein ExoM
MHTTAPISAAQSSIAGTLPAPHLVVGLCTYKRLVSLERLLEHIVVAARHVAHGVTIIVVDNDGKDPRVEESTRRISAQSAVPICYAVELTPGISAARNLVFREAGRLGARFMAMIDDDEWPPPGWLAELLKTQAKTGAVVVGAPVHPVFPAQAAHLRKYSRYWSVQAQHLDGKPFVFCSCNFLVDLQAIADEARPLFDDAFGLSGGGDTVFFRKLFFAGHAMAWTERAWIYEEVPASRASMRWMRTRRYRVGNHAVRWEQEGRRPLAAVAKTLGLSLRLLAYPLWRREPESPWVGWLLEFDKVRGRWASHCGQYFVEYARTAPGTKACG